MFNPSLFYLVVIYVSLFIKFHDVLRLLIAEVTCCNFCKDIIDMNTHPSVIDSSVSNSLSSWHISSPFSSFFTHFIYIHIYIFSKYWIFYSDLRVPWWITPIMTERLFLTKSLEWSLSFCILEYMFNEQFVISTSFLKKVTLLQTRLRVVGVVHMILLPFMVLFMSIHFFLQNAQSFHSR